MANLSRIIDAVAEEHPAETLEMLALVCFVLPAALSLIFNEIMRKLGWIKYGDMKLDL